MKPVGPYTPVVRAGDWLVVSGQVGIVDGKLVPGGTEGEVHCEEREIECWKHGSTFSLLDGEPQSLPATMAEPVFPVRVDGDDVIVTVGDTS